MPRRRCGLSLPLLRQLVLVISSKVVYLYAAGAQCSRYRRYRQLITHAEKKFSHVQRLNKETKSPDGQNNRLKITIFDIGIVIVNNKKVKIAHT